MAQGEKRENSVLFSLRELRQIEENRVQEEENAVRSAEEARIRAKEEAERRRREEEEAKIHAEREHQRQVEEARLAAEREARLRTPHQLRHLPATVGSPGATSGGAGVSYESRTTDGCTVYPRCTTCPFDDCLKLLPKSLHYPVTHAIRVWQARQRGAADVAEIGQATGLAPNQVKAGLRLLEKVGR